MADCLLKVEEFNLSEKMSNFGSREIVCLKKFDCMQGLNSDASCVLGD